MYRAFQLYIVYTFISHSVVFDDAEAVYDDGDAVFDHAEAVFDHAEAPQENSKAWKKYGEAYKCDLLPKLLYDKLKRKSNTILPDC